MKKILSFFIFCSVFFAANSQNTVTLGNQGTEYGAAGFTPGTNNNAGVGATTITGSGSPTAKANLTNSAAYDVNDKQYYTSKANGDSSKATFINPCTPQGDQVTYGNGSWIGYVYKWTGSPSFNSQDYVGYVTDSEQFDANVTLRAIRGLTTVLCVPYNFPPTDYFTVRYKMTKNFPAGYYKFSVGCDEGMRLSLDGGNSWFTQNWQDQTYTVYTSQLVYLSGSTNLVLEYYERTGNARISFSYSIPCPTPTALSIGSITATSASASFTSGGSSFIVEYGAAGFTPGSGSSAGVGGTIVTGNSSPINLTGLTGGTAYDVYIRQNCTGSYNGYSANSSKVSFTTPCQPQGDEVSYGNDSWKGYVYTWTGSPSFNSANYKGYVAENEQFDRDNALGAIAGQTTNLCPTIPSDNFTVRYKMTKNFPAGYYKFSVGGDDGVRLSVDGGNTWLVNVWNDQSYTIYTSSLVYLNGSTNLVLEYYDNTGDSRISFSYTIPCTTPTAFNIGSITPTSALASFTSGGSAFIVEYGAAGFTPGTNGSAGVGGTIVTGSTSPIALTGLTGSTAYDVYVRQDCSGSGNGYSVNSSKVSFTTLCPPQGDEVSYGNDSWKGYVYTWTGSPSFNSANYKGYVTENEQFDRDNGGGAIAGLTTNLCPTIPSDNFTVRYKMTKNFPAGYYKFSVGGDDGVRLSIDDGNTWLVNVWNDQSYTIYTSSLVYLNGSTNLVLEYYDNTGDSRISFSYTIPCTTPTAFNIGSITPTSASASFTSGGSSFIVEYGAAGFTPGTNGSAGVGGTVVTGSTSPIALTGLTGSTAYDVYVRQDCSGSGNGYSVNSSKVSFTTLCPPQGDEVSYGNDSWKGYVYTWTGSPSFNSANYKGYVTENEQFDRDNGGGAIAGLTTNLCPPIPSNGYTVRYKMTKNFPAGYYKFSVGGDDGVRLSVDGGNTWLVNEWIIQSYAIFTSSLVYLNGSTNLVFEYFENDGDSRISFSYTIPCSTPTALSIGSITNSSASASFTGVGSAFIVEYGSAGFTPGTDNNPGVGGTVVTGSASPIAISGLTGSTTYDVYVRQDCTSDVNGYSTNSSKATFTTLCDTINTYPFTEGFNNASLPACWSVSEGSPGATQHWQIVTGTYYGAGSSAEGSHFLNIDYNAAQTSYNPYYLNSAPFNLGATAKRAKFSIWMGVNSGTNNLKFEISTDGGSTWTTLSTYTANPANNNPNAPWENKIVNLSAYSNQTVLFRLNATSNWGIGYCNIGFDNFRVEEIPPCTTPTALSIGSITTTSASLSFTGVGSAFIVEYGAPGFIPGTNGSAGIGGTVVTGSASPIVLTGLTSSTTYDVYVRQDCTSDDNGYSANSSKVTFITLCNAAVNTYPFTEGFNNASLPTCWFAYEGSPGAWKHWEPVTTDNGNGAEASAEGSHFLRINFNAAPTSYNPYYLKSVAFNLGATAKRAKFSIWMGANSGTNSLKFEISTDGGNSWTTLSTYTANPANNNANAPWISKTVDLSAYSNQTVLFRLNATSNYSSNYCNIGFDNFRVEDIPACTEPEDLSVGSVTNSSASVSFTGVGSAFVLEYGAAGFTPGTNGSAGVGGTVVTGSASPISLSGLTGNTTYDVYVRQDCTGSGNGYSVNSSKTTFTTACDAINTYPFTEGFNSASLPACWSVYEGSPGASRHWQPVTSDTRGARASAEGSHFLRMKYEDANNSYNPYYLQSGSFNLGATAKRAKFSIWMGANSGTNNLKFEISTDGGNSWTTLSTYTANPVNNNAYAPWENKKVDLSSYINQTVVFRLNATSNYGSYYCNIGFDNFRVEDIPACIEAEDVSVGSITNSSASVSFTGVGSAFIVEYGAPGFTPGTDGNAGVGGTVVAGSASPISIYALTANTTYDVYVRQNCTGSGNGYSTNSSKVTFTTLCNATTVPYTQNFETATEPALPDCTTQEKIGYGNYWVTYDNPGNGFTTKTLIYEYNSDYAANTWFYTQGIHLTQGTSYTISYRYGNNNSFYPEKLKVAYGTSPSNGAMTNTLADHPNINQATPQSNTVTFTPPSTGVYYFGFNAYSDADMYYLLVDDIVIDIVPWTWTGTTNTDWNTASNWDRGTVPTSISNIIIPNVTNKPVLGVNYTIIREANNITIQTGSSLTITKESSFLVYGNFINNGTIIADTGKIAFVGTSLQTFNTGSTDIILKNLAMDNAVGLTVTGIGKLNIIGDLITYKQGVLTTNNLIVLKSNENGTAFFQSLFNLSTINGNVTVERYIPAKASRKWSFLTSPIRQNLNESWQQQIHITGAGTGGTVCPTLTSHSNGFDATLTNAPNAYTYDASQTTGNRWKVVNNTNATMLGHGTGFRINVRGPRSLGCDLLNGTNMVPSAVTLSTTGTFSTANKNMGTFSITYPNNGINNWVLIGNPYPGHLAFNKSYGLLSDVSNSNNIEGTYAVYIPSNNAGVYTYWSDTDWEFTGGTGYKSDYGDFISSGQAVFVQSKVAGNITLNFNEDMKLFNPGVETGYFRDNRRTFNEKVKVSYGTMDNKIDEIVVRYANDAEVSNTVVGKMDIPSMNYGTYITSIKDNQPMVVQTRLLNTLSNDEVWLNIGATKSGNYKFTFSDYENFTGADIYLIDHLANIMQDVKQNTEYIFSVDINNAATKGSNRFSLVFTKRYVEQPIVQTSIKMYPNPANKQVTFLLPQSADISYQIKVNDMAGKIVLQKRTAGGVQQLRIDNLTAGSYFVEIVDSKGNRTTEKLVKQ